MVVGLGIDLVELDRIERALGRWGSRFVEKIMDPEESAGLPAEGRDRVHAVAQAVAAKEAASKAIGTGWSHGVYWRDVVLTRNPDPEVRLLREAARFARRLGSSGRTRLRFEERGNLLLAHVRLLS